jgi:hypothetical protein
LGYDSLE